MKVWVDVITILLIILFAYAGVTKWMDIKGTFIEIDNQPFPNTLTPLLVILIPGSELVAACCLVFERTRLAGLYLSAALLFAFTIYTALILFHVFDYVPCSCGGVIKHLSWAQHLGFNLSFLLTSITGLLIHRKNQAALAGKNIHA